ncbi:MAG: dipeptidase [Anaerolineae bacterium]|nr:dipeptidase [Anaerolineae bacterium]
MATPQEYIAENLDKFRTQLMDWLSIPSISTDPTKVNSVRQAAEWLAADMMRIGLENVEIMPTAGHPAVYAEWNGAGADAPTVLVYGHYDVQPAVIEDGWDGDPFIPRLQDGKIYARGATDDKGQTMIQMKAVETMLATGGCPVNLKYLIEGEEEIGSAHLAEFVEQHKEKLAADYCLISDTGIAGEDQPLLVYSLRGIVTMTVRITGPVRDLHSGKYGGMIHNPAQAAAEIVAQLHKPDGSVAVPGFYDDVLALSDDEREQLAKADVTAEEWAAAMADLPDWGEAGYSKIERTGARPTLEINGIQSGYAGDGFKTVLPAQAIVKVSCRIVANQDPEDIYNKVKSYIESLAPDTVRVKVSSEHNGHPALTPIDHPAVQAAVRAYAKNFPNPPLYVRGGGSIPVVAELQRILGTPVVLLGFGLPDSQAHGPNESFHLVMFEKGIQTVVDFMNEMAQA